MTIRSAIPATVTAVLSLASTAVAGQTSLLGSPVQVVDGELGTFVPDEFVQVTSVTNGSQVWATLGTTRRNEAFDVVGMVRAYVGSDDQVAVRQRVFDLWALVETALDNDPSLGGVVNGSAEASVRDLRMGVTDAGGRAAELDFSIAVTTQLIAT